MKLLLKLKNSILLNLISFLGNLGFIVFIYSLFFSSFCHGYFAQLPYISFHTAKAYLTFSVFLFFIFFALLPLECFINRFLEFKNKKNIYVQYLSFVPNWLFVSGLIISILAVLVYFFMWWLLVY